MAADLAPFYIKNVEGIDLKQCKGSGSYGSVYQVTVNGYPCIAKRLHDILVGPQHVNPEERLAISSRFREECMLLSQLRHPNIVQFIGVHCGRREDDLTLLMEGLYMDLEQCLTVHSSIPLPIQLLILLDVAYGLLYLHSQSPPIVHRDLKASSVLLTSDMRAKLADLGVSKILEAHPLSEVVRTACPGTHGVMPPEALVEKPSYTTKLDVFSFGTLVLHVVNHEFPMPFETDTFEKGKQHITKRRSSLKKMGETHCLSPLVVRCLQDDHKKRPSIAEVCSALRELSREHPRKFENILVMYNEISGKEDECEKLMANQTTMRKELEESHQMLESSVASSAKLHDDVLVKTQQMKQYKKQVDGYKAQMGELKAEMDGVKADLGVYQQQTMQPKQQLAGAQQMAADMEALQRERDSLAAQLQMLKGRKSNESEFATAFQKEFDKRDEFEKQNEMLKRYSDRLLQENNKLTEVLKHNNIPCPALLPQPPPPAADILRAGGPVVPRSPSDQQRALGHPTPQQTPTHPSRFDPRHHQQQYQPQHDYPPQQQHLQQERQHTVLPREQGRVQQMPAPQQPHLKEAAVFHQRAHVEPQGLVQQQELGGQGEAQEKAHQQQLEQQTVDQREAQARALYMQQLEQQTVAVREAQARAIRQQQLEQQAVDQRERALHQQQAVAQREAQERALCQQQLLEQREAVEQAHERRVLQQQQIEQQQQIIYRKQMGSQGPLKPQMKAYSVDDSRHAYGQPQVVPQPHPNVEAITTHGGGVPSEGGAILLDLNLVCPLCNKIFRIGEMQTFRRHVNSCTGT